jgi:hypothetical protein
VETKEQPEKPHGAYREGLNAQADAQRSAEIAATSDEIPEPSAMEARIEDIRYVMPE